MKILREQNLDICVIKISGIVLDEFAADVLKEGTDDYIREGNLARFAPCGA
jgi:hypothetical protein